MIPRTVLIALFARKLASVIVLVPVLAACSSVENATLRDSPEYTAALPSGKYVIAPGDELEIRFFHSSELDTTLPVRPDGFIALPFVREVEAAGKTAEELAGELKGRYAPELFRPEIAVIVRSFSSLRVHVGGKVSDPGILPLAEKMTVLDSIFAAGGTEIGALLSEVVVIRRKPDGSYLVIPVDVEAVLDGTKVAENLRLLPYDAIYVPHSPIAHVNDWVDLYIRRNIPINFGVRPELGGI